MTPPPTTPAPGAVQPGTVPLADAIQAVWKQWHTVPFSNSDMTLAVSALGKARPQLPALCARVAALEGALRDMLRAYHNVPVRSEEFDGTYQRASAVLRIERGGASLVQRQP